MSLTSFPFGEGREALNGVAMGVILLVIAILLTPPVLKLAGWYYSLWGLP